MQNRVDLPLMNILERYIRNFRCLNIFQNQNKSMFTKRELEYFSRLGEYLGFFSYIEDTKPNLDYGRSRPMDLAWWKWDERISKTHFVKLILHLERESQFIKDFETIEKLFCTTEDAFTPENVIGILNVSSFKIVELQEEVKKRNKRQKSNVLMIYRYYDEQFNFDRIEGHYMSRDLETTDVRLGISKIDETGYWTMCFEEEYEKQID